MFRMLNSACSTPPFVEPVKAVSHYFSGFRPELVFGGHIDSKPEVELQHI